MGAHAARKTATHGRCCAAADGGARRCGPEELTPTGAAGREDELAEHLESGRRAEHAAKRYLEDQGLHWLTSNYRCRYGELDLVMSDEEHLLIIEIRYRRHSVFMQPLESITRAKCARIAKATMHFMQHSAKYENFPVRFDVLSVSGPLQRPRMNWIRGAFTADDIGVG